MKLSFTSEIWGAVNCTTPSARLNLDHRDPPLHLTDALQYLKIHSPRAQSYLDMENRWKMMEIPTRVVTRVESNFPAFGCPIGTYHLNLLLSYILENIFFGSKYKSVATFWKAEALGARASC